MRIGIDAKRAFHNFRGLGNFSRTLIENLLRYSDHELRLFTPSWKSDRATSWYRSLHGHKVETVSESGWLGSLSPSLWRTFGIAGDLRDHPVDVYHGLSHELPRGLPSSLKKVVTVHDILFHLHPESFSFIDRRTYRNKLLHACKEADCIVSITERTKLDLVEHFNMEPSRIRVVYQTCDHTFFDRTADDEREQWLRQKGLDPGNYLLFVGAMVPHKNPMGLLKAWLASNTVLPLVFVGSGPERDKVMAAFKNNSGGKEAFFLEGMTLKELRRLYEGAKAFLWPSFYEGFGIPLIEAINCGTPCLTSVGSCFHEAAGEGALYVDPSSHEELKNGIDRITSDEHLRSELLRKGSVHVEKFRPQRLTEDLNQVYQSLF